MKVAHNKGFTLVELLVTMAIIGIAVGMAVPSYYSIQRSITLSTTSQEVVSALRAAQKQAISAQSGMAHGVSFSSGSYTIFRTDGINPPTSVETHVLTGVTATTGQVTFTKLIGNTATGSTLTYTLNASGRQKTITVNAATGTVSAS